jgi:phosphoglycerate dehydrogenase-like enzyme
MEDGSSRLSRPIVVCLGYPALHAPENLERIRALDPRFEALTLPVDPGGDWGSPAPEHPYPEPPPWATAVARERRDVLARTEVLIALQTSSELMQWCPNLRWVQGVGAGIEQFAAAGVPRDRVVVTNASGISSASMAEFVIGRLLAVWKRFREAEDHQRNRDFTRTYGKTFAGTTLGVVGFGNIGIAVARRARAFGVRVLGMRRSYRDGDTSPDADQLFGPDALHEMLGLCDSVVVAAPATPQTAHLIDAAALAAMRPGSVLVNVARGSLLDEAALTAALQSGHISAAILDVFEVEPLPQHSPLWDLPGVYVSAHSSVSVDRYMQDVFELFADNLGRYARGEALRNTVDMAALGFS